MGVNTRGCSKTNADIAMINSRKDWIKIGLLDIEVSPLTAHETASIVTSMSGRKRLLLNHNLHSAYMHETDTEFRELYQLADWVIIDGTPILWLASWASGHRLSHALRIGSTDWIAALPQVELSAQRLFVYGATAQSNARAVDNLRSLLPNWNISGIDGYIDHQAAIAAIEYFRPDLVIVGLGMPLQERFLLRNYSRLPDAIYATVGGAIDYLAGAKQLAPRWISRVGAEWLWRLLCEPQRLWRRYLVEPLLLIGRIAVRKLR